MKRFAALLLALLLTLAMTTAAFAAKPKATGTQDPDDIDAFGYYDMWLEDRLEGSLEEYAYYKDQPDEGDLDFDIYEGSTLYICPSYGSWTELFTWENGVEEPQLEDYIILGSDGYPMGPASGYATLDDAEDALDKAWDKYYSSYSPSAFERIKPRHTPSKFIESIGWEWYDNGISRFVVLAVHFIDDFVMTKEVQQELEFWFSVGGKSYKDFGFAIDANFTFVEEALDKGQRTAESFHENLGGIVLEPQANFSGFELNIGEGGEDVFVTTNLFEGHKIYASAKLKWAEEFNPLFLNAERLVAIYTLRSANLYPNACRVRLDFPNPVAYVYDAEGKYIGTTREELPWSGMYFVSERKRESIVPEVTTPQAEKVQMTMTEYLYWLATGMIPDSASVAVAEGPAGDPGTLLS